MENTMIKDEIYGAFYKVIYELDGFYHAIDRGGELVEIDKNLTEEITPADEGAMSNEEFGRYDRTRRIDFARGPVKFDKRRGIHYRECWEFVEGKWEAFTSMSSK